MRILDLGCGNAKYKSKNDLVVGIDNIKLDNPNTTTHTKLIIVDGKIVLVGSTNWSHTAINKNHEANVLIYSEEVAQEFERYFSKIWSES